MKRVLSVFATICGVVTLGTLTMLAQGPVKVDLKDAKGASVGTATITAARSGGGVSIALDVKNLPAGEHGIHIHATPSCEGANFAGAGGHFNPTNKKHGMLNPAGIHAGDLPNLVVGANGEGRLEYTSPQFTLWPGGWSLMKPGGTAIVVHADPDDETTDPSGGSGARIACGVISPA